MPDYLQNFAVAFFGVILICAIIIATIVAAGKLMLVYGPIVIFVALILAVAVAAGIGFANDERRKKETA